MTTASDAAPRPTRAISLMYHDATADGDVAATGFQGAGADHYKLDIDDMERHFAAIDTASATKPTMRADAIGDAGSGAPLFLTFDDGGVSAATLIAERLERRGWIGHFFITGERIGAPGFVDAAQLRDLHARGHVIGSHSWSHPVQIASCDRAQLLMEWRKSVDALTEILGAAVTTASVPGGFYSRAVAETASEAGVSTLFNSEPQQATSMVGGCLILGRYALTRGMAPEISGALATPGPTKPQLAQYALWNAKKVAKRVAGPGYRLVRDRLLARKATQ